MSSRRPNGTDDLNFGQRFGAGVGSLLRAGVGLFSGEYGRSWLCWAISLGRKLGRRLSALSLIRIQIRMEMPVGLRGRAGLIVGGL